MNKNSQCELTEHYLRSTTGVYKYVEPTRKYHGEYRPINNPTAVTFRRQIKSITERLQNKCNNLWKTICIRHNLDDSITRGFLSSNTQLPAMHILLKTHKFNVSQISNSLDINQVCKIRPIVSCVSSPTEKLAWLCTHILTPLLEFIPCHLNNIFQHLEHLSQLTPEQLAGKQFCSGDISSLYTNINIQSCITDIIAFMDEHKSHINLYGLKLIDIEEMLELVLGDAYFTYNSRVFLQLVYLSGANLIGTLHDRLSEHLRYASNPNKPCYKEEASATHYREFHPGTSPSLSFKLLHTKRNTIMRKIFEAYIISNLKPNINDKDECIDIKRFLINA